MSEHALRTITGSSSFRGFYAFRDGAAPNRAVSLKTRSGPRSSPASARRPGKLARAS